MIVVTRGLPQEALELLGEDAWVSPHDRPLAPDELHEAIAGAAGVVTMLHDRVDDAFLDAAGPSLRVVANVAVGYDNIDVEACRARDVVVTNTPGVLVDATADLAMALILMVTRRLGEGERLIRAGHPWAWSIDFMLGRSLRGKRLGIVGYGDIGRAVSARASVFGMEVVWTSRSSGSVTLDELVATSDVISLHCPLNDETRGLFDAERLSSMKPTAYLVNTARGPIVDEAALATALREGEIAGAALDVFEEEPRVHPGLVGLEQVVLIPHLGSATVETRIEMASLAVSNALAVVAGEEPLTPVR